MNVHRIVVCDNRFVFFLNVDFYFSFISDLEATNTKKETIRKKPIVKKKSNFLPHYPQPTQMMNNNNHHHHLQHPTPSHQPPPPPPPYTMSNCYQQAFYNQYSMSATYSHIEQFQLSPPPTSQCEIADQELYFPINYPSFSL